MAARRDAAGETEEVRQRRGADTGVPGAEVLKELARNRGHKDTAYRLGESERQRKQEPKRGQPNPEVRVESGVV